ncbi:MAG: DUF2779 domain-containing protein [Rhodocyclaceae bacterium]|nr:DUF2779 domain-containing protein [Rhodocyclaceae bacterium]
MKPPQPLTKSRFKLALECPTRLFYAANVKGASRPDGYVDRRADDDFLKALADGGYQVGELAKFRYHPDPVNAGITIDTLDAAVALAETRARLAGPGNTGVPGRTVIAEAALAAGDLLVRVDILIADQTARTLDLIEVKSKSVDAGTVSRDFRNRNGYESDWMPYLYDVAFQTLVARRALEGWGMADWQVRPRLVLLDKEAVAKVDGLHQNFAITGERDAARKRDRIRVESPPGLTPAQLDLDLLREVDLVAIVEDLLNMPVAVPHTAADHTRNLPTFVEWAATLQREGTRHFGGVSAACKQCPYRARPGEAGRSGVNECMADAVRAGMLDARTDLDALNLATPLAIDLWGGKAGPVSMAGKALEQRRAFLADIREDDIRPRQIAPDRPGMHPHERRMAQVAHAGGGDAVVMCEDTLRRMDGWAWPLHMIDFETSAPALPFLAGMRPYQVMAFQFSHHVMHREADGGIRIEHANHWISTRPGHDPNVDFVRALRDALMPDGELHGTVFRYHNHENTVLRSLRGLLVAQADSVPDAADLIAFIDLITHATGKEDPHKGAKDMVDLHALVEAGYWSARAGGSVSLKYILPAVLHDAPGVAARYSQPGVYGQGLPIISLNVPGPDGHVWLTPEANGDPYRTLPPVFGPEHGDLDAMLFRLAENEDEDAGEGVIAQGGVAMTAWNYTQFARLGDAERQRIEQALLRYCELDTLAMVILVEGLMEIRAGT